MSPDQGLGRARGHCQFEGGPSRSWTVVNGPCLRLREHCQATPGDLWLYHVAAPVSHAGTEGDRDVDSVATTASSSRSSASPAVSGTSRTTKGASSCRARPTWPREMPAFEVSPAQIRSGRLQEEGH